MLQRSRTDSTPPVCSVDPLEAVLLCGGIDRELRSDYVDYDLAAALPPPEDVSHMWGSVGQVMLTSPRSGSSAAARQGLSSAFVGRDADLETLVDHLCHLDRSAHPGLTGRSGQAGGALPGLLLVEGEPGMGKTALLGELTRRTTELGWRAVWGHSWDELGTPPYWPWTQVARELQGIRGTDLGEVVLDGSAAADRFELFHATVDVVRQAAQDGPLLVLLDDLHAADRSTLLLTRFVAEQVAGCPVGVVGAYRSGRAAADPAIGPVMETLAQVGVQHRLEGLSPEAVAVLTGDAERAAHVHEVTGGNPLFLEQVVRVASPGAGAGTDLPRALRTAIATRIGWLTADEREVLLALAVVGRQAGAAQVAAMLAHSGPAADRVEEGLHALLAAGLVRREGSSSWAVAHSLVAEVAVEGAGSGETAALHHRAALLIGAGRERQAERAQHLLQAGPAHRSEAVGACMVAAAVAAEMMAHADAVAHLERALTVLDEAVDGADSGGPGGAEVAAGVARAEPDRLRLQVLLALGEAQRHSGHRLVAERTFARAAELAEVSGDVEGHARAALQGGIQYYFGGDRGERLARPCRAALADLPDCDSRLRARLLAELAAKLVAGAVLPEGQALAAEAVAMARRVGDPVALGSALIAQQVTALGPAALPQRLLTAREVLALARRTGDPTLTVQGRFLLMVAQLEQGDIGGLDTELTTQHDVVAELADHTTARFAYWLACTRAQLHGRVGDVEALAQRCLELSLEIDDPDGPGVYGAQVGVARWLQGREAELEPLLEEQRRSNPGQLVWPATLAWLWSAQGRLDEARGVLAELGNPADLPEDMHRLLTMVTAADAAVTMGDDDLAERLREELLPYGDRFVPVGVGAAVWGTVACRLGRLALQLGRPDEGLARLEQAVDLCERMGARPWLVEARLDLASALLDVGRGDDVRLQGLVTAARDEAQQLDLARFVDRAESLQRRVGFRRSAPPVVAPTGRTRPQVAVLGTFEAVSVDGQVARWTSRKARELLKILVARRGVPVHRETLMGLLWPDLDPEVLGNRMSVALSTVRRALAPGRTVEADELVQAEGETLRLRTDRLDVDVERFLSLARQAMAAHARGAECAQDALLAAAHVHRGPALPDEPYAEWAAPLQSEVRLAYLQVVRALADRAVAAGDDLTALDAYQRLVAADPFDARVHEDLAGALDRLGAAGPAAAERQRYRALRI